MNSRAKGKRGELEVAELLREMGFEARRSQQYNGAAGGADVEHNIGGVHVEVKLTERLRPHAFMEQAVRDCKGKRIPTVWMRSNCEDWLVCVRATDLFALVDRLNAARLQARPQVQPPAPQAE